MKSKKTPIYYGSRISLRRQIALRKEHNRKRRNAAGEQMEQWRVRYQRQKETVREMILEEKGEHEEKIASEIKQENTLEKLCG